MKINGTIKFDVISLHKVLQIYIEVPVEITRATIVFEIEFIGFAGNRLLTYMIDAGSKFPVGCSAFLICVEKSLVSLDF